MRKIKLVVGVFLVLFVMGLLYPGFGARHAAKRAKTQVQVCSEAVALKVYFNEYGFWPNRSEGVYTNDHALTALEIYYLYRILSGEDVSLDGKVGGKGGNPRKIVFLDYKQRELAQVGNDFRPVASGGVTNFINLSGNSIRAAIDYNGDGKVVPWSGAEPVQGGMPVWTVYGEGVEAVQKAVAVWSVYEKERSWWQRLRGAVPETWTNVSWR